MRNLAKEGPEAIKTALKDAKPEMRLIAVLHRGQLGLALTEDLIERLTDDNSLVRQAARRRLWFAYYSARWQAHQGTKRRFWPGRERSPNRSAPRRARWNDSFAKTAEGKG